MKKTFFSFIACLAFVTAFANTNPATTTNSNPFNDNLSAMEQEFAGLNALEQEVDARNVTYNDLAAENSALLNNVTENQDLGNALLGAGGSGDDNALGIPGFWWGFCLLLVGVLIVALTIDNDRAKKEQIRKALIGCVVGVGGWLLFWLLLGVLSAL
jgi:hypothetical protein